MFKTLIISILLLNDNSLPCRGRYGMVCMQKRTKNSPQLYSKNELPSPL